MDKIGTKYDNLNQNLETSQSPHSRQTVDTVSNSKGIEECSKDRKDHDGDKVVKESVIIKSQGSVKDDRRKEKLKEEWSCELREGMLCFVLNVEDVIEDDVVDENSSKDPHNNEDAGLG